MTEVADNTLVDGRYRIVERIGSGGMADVYKAEDTHLGREVALKVLHRRFAQDQEFVERFRREARSAAGLQHPHVVGVFDRGEHDGTYYIAMEYLPGRTLKEIVNAQAPLPQESVIDLGLQILAAAGFAHRHQVIHRDFKPHNVIVDDAWQAKVTDFGIARAGASEMTETGSIMGTAQYLSPEQAQGHAVGGTSDLYSIGVMLYELLTGRVPFAGDSAVAVALKHLSEPPTPISQLRPDVHPTLESVVMAALAKDPAQRWQTAEEFAAALSTARDQIASGAAAPRDTAEFAAAAVALPGGPAEAAANGGSPPDRPAPPGEPERERRWPWFTIGIMALALLALLGFLAVSGLLSADKKEVPRVVGKQLIQARQQLERAGFEVTTERVKSSADLDDVVDQHPNAGEQADEGSTVTLVVSNGPGDTLVPAVEGQTRAQAIRTLEKKAGFDVTVSDEPSDSVPDGIAVRTFPREGTSVEAGSRVRLVISSGPEQVEVPDVTGLSRGSAEDSLTSEHLKVSVREEASDQPKDEVVSQDPAGGTEVDSGSRVTITISTGPEQVEVPDVTGLGPSAAARELKAAGLKAVRRESPTLDEAEDGLVVRQAPDSGGQVDKGSSVVVYVGVFTPTDNLENQAPASP
jgi:eukaryotic-like serine/threonine-protein kinase